MHIHLQYLVSESVLQKCLHVCKRAITYLSLPSVRPFHIFNHGCQSSLDHPGFCHHFFFPSVPSFTLSQNYFPKKQIQSWPYLLKNFCFTVAYRFFTIFPPPIISNLPVPTS